MGHVRTSGLTPGDAVSVSAYVFNNPDQCALGAGKCMIGDVESTMIDGTAVDLRGGVVDSKGNLVATLEPVRHQEMDVRSGSGNLDTETAELLVVLRSHGPAIAGQVADQISSYDAACDVQSCEDVQFIRF